MQGQWVYCPACRQATAPGYACQRCGAPMQQMPMQQVPMQQMPMQQTPMGMQQPQKSGMGVGVIVLILLGVFVLLGGCVGVGAFLMLRSSNDSYSSSTYTPTTSPTPIATPAPTPTVTGPYTDKLGRYSVDFPGDPKLDSSSDDTELGKVTLHEAKYEANKNLVYAVNYTDFPISGRAFSTEGALDGAVNGASKSQGGTIVYSNKIKLGTVSGRDFMVKVSDPTTPFRICSRVFQDGARQYQVLVLVSEGQYITKKSDIDDFLKSFKIL